MYLNQDLDVPQSPTVFIHADRRALVKSTRSTLITMCLVDETLALLIVAAILAHILPMTTY